MEVHEADRRERWGPGSYRIRIAMTKSNTRATFEVLAESYRSEAEVCRQRANEITGTRKEEWLRLSDEWIKLANEADAMWWLT